MKKLDPLIWKNTFKWQYEAYPFFNSVYIKVAERTKNKYFMCADNFLTLFRGGFFIGLLPNQEVFYIGRKVIKESLKGKKDFLEEFKKVYGQIDVAVADCEEAIKKNNFADLNKWWFSTQTALSNVSHILFNFDYVFDEFLQDLQANNPEDKKALDFYIVSDTPSFFEKSIVVCWN